VDLLRLQVLATLEQARQRYRDASIKEDLEVMFHMYNLDPNDPVVRLVSRAMVAMGLKPDIRPSGGGTDANAMRLHGIDCVVVGMATNEMHTVNEYVVIPDLMGTARFCERIMSPSY
jgi:tripeptide aminopeptidase